MQDSEKALSEALMAQSRARLAACEKVDGDVGVRLVRSQDAIRRSRELLKKTLALVRVL